MPFRDNQTHFRDILDAIDLINDFVEDADFHAYEKDLKTKSAVERQMQIVTEAAYRVDKEGEKLAPDIDWTGLRGMGNILRHGYHKVDDQIVWNTIQEDLPRIREDLARALESSDEAAESTDPYSSQ